MQLELLEKPAGLTRAGARRAAHEAAKARADLGVDRSAGRANATAPGWLNLALERVRAFARANPGVFTVEMMRIALDAEVPSAGDLRAWGRVTIDAISLGYIERVPMVYIPAASSNNSPKAAYRRGKMA